MSFLSSLFTGSNPTLSSQVGALGSIASTATKQGQGGVSDAISFWHNILSGGGTKVLAPQISGIQQQGQQRLQGLSQFGNRSGGTNAAAQTVGDTTRSSINDLVASLTGGAASSLGSLGSSLLNTGLSAYGQQANVAQQQQQNLMNSILGKGISSGIGFAESFGLGKL